MFGIELWFSTDILLFIWQIILRFDMGDRTICMTSYRTIRLDIRNGCIGFGLGLIFRKCSFWFWFFFPHFFFHFYATSHNYGKSWVRDQAQNKNFFSRSRGQGWKQPCLSTLEIFGKLRKKKSSPFCLLFCIMNQNNDLTFHNWNKNDICLWEWFWAD